MTSGEKGSGRKMGAGGKTGAGEGSEPGERLQKVLARRGVASRRGAEELIKKGRVIVNGAVAQLGVKVQPGDAIAVDGEPLAGEAERFTVMLNKPRGYLTTVHDDRGRRTVMELLPEVNGLHPVGRLDLDSEGLLLLTTDGDLTMELTHPRFGHTKTYRVWCEQGEVGPAALEALRNGIELEDGRSRAVRALRRSEGCELVLAEGRKRQVRRMLQAVGYQVSRLQRVAVGSLELGELPVGEWRALEPSEIELALKTK